MTIERRIQNDAEEVMNDLKVVRYRPFIKKCIVAGAKAERNKVLTDVISKVNDYWKFDRHQMPISSWHDKNDLLELLESLKIKP